MAVQDPSLCVGEGVCEGVSARTRACVCEGVAMGFHTKTLHTRVLKKITAYNLKRC